jgi:hypothetical protein
VFEERARDERGGERMDYIKEHSWGYQGVLREVYPEHSVSKVTRVRFLSKVRYEPELYLYTSTHVV